MIEDRVSRSRIDDRFGAGAPKASRPIDIRLPKDNICFWRAVDVGNIRPFFGWVDTHYAIIAPLDRAIQ